MSELLYEKQGMIAKIIIKEGKHYDYLAKLSLA